VRGHQVGLGLLSTQDAAERLPSPELIAAQGRNHHRPLQAWENRSRTYRWRPEVTSGRQAPFRKATGSPEIGNGARMSWEWPAKIESTGSESRCCRSMAIDHDAWKCTFLAKKSAQVWRSRVSRNSSPVFVIALVHPFHLRAAGRAGRGCGSSARPSGRSASCR